MATELHYDRDACLMRTRAYGEVTVEDLISHPKHQVAEAPEGVGVLYEVLDAREVTKISAYVLELVAQVPKMLEQLKPFKGVRLAIISDNDYVYGHANQLAYIFQKSVVSVEVFRSEEKALAWLEEQRRLDLNS